MWIKKRIYFLTLFLDVDGLMCIGIISGQDFFLGLFLQNDVGELSFVIELSWFCCFSVINAG